MEFLEILKQSLADAEFRLPRLHSPKPLYNSKDIRWQKFPGQIYGLDLKVALESTFPKELLAQLTPSLIQPKSLPQGMNFENEYVIRYYHPAISKELDKGREILFMPRFTKEGELFRRLVFRRKMIPDFPNEGRMQMMLARFGEDKPFGFSCWEEGDKGNAAYVSLAFPGKSGDFVPVYARIEEYPTPVFLKIEAEETTEGVLVCSRAISPEEVPPHLL